jgi:hypothetical protein
VYTPVLVHMACIVLLVSNVCFWHCARAERAHPYWSADRVMRTDPSIVAAGWSGAGVSREQQFVLGPFPGDLAALPAAARWSSMRWISSSLQTSPRPSGNWRPPASPLSWPGWVVSRGDGTHQSFAKPTATSRAS